MKYRFLHIVIFLILSVDIYGQSRLELESQRKKTLEEIGYVDNMLTNTIKQKSESINAVRILSNKVALRERVVKGLESEKELINARIEINTLGIDMMEKDLEELIKDYRSAIVNSYKSTKIFPAFIFILSAGDFNQGYKRFKYLQQVTRYRRNQAEIITDLKKCIEDTRLKLEEDRLRINELQRSEIVQKNLLQGEQTRKQRMVQSLGTREKQLKKELDEKKRIAKKLETEIARIIEEERKKAETRAMTSEDKIVGENFAENKGRLPWPSEKGIITSKYGTHQHPVLKYVTEDNIGIEISSTGKTMARTVFKGTVMAITAISGSNMTVIISHGKYRTVYSNLVNVKVRKGDNVNINQEIGEVFQEKDSPGTCILKFMIYNEEYLDPELWLVKK